MENEIEVKTFVVQYLCDKCASEVKYKGDHIVLTDKFPQFKHFCEGCNEEYLFNHKYPYTKYLYL